MRKIFLISVLAILLLMPVWGRWQKDWVMLDAPINIGTDVTAWLTTDFESPARDVRHYDGCTLTIIFTRAAGAADTVDVDIEIHNGREWASLRQYNGNPLIQVPTNTGAITGTTVRIGYQVDLSGVKYIRIRSVENTDSANAITNFNVTISM